MLIDIMNRTSISVERCAVMRELSAKSNRPPISSTS